MSTSVFTFRHAASALVLGACLFGATGCSSSSGGDDDSVVQQQSYGQQLLDLDAAHKKGLVTDKEYEKSRKAIIKKMDD